MKDHCKECRRKYCRLCIGCKDGSARMPRRKIKIETEMPSFAKEVKK